MSYDISIRLPSWLPLLIDIAGRTHRSNQVTAPEYIFLISELAGERRFASIVAKRLESLVNIISPIHVLFLFCTFTWFFLLKTCLVGEKWSFSSHCSLVCEKNLPTVNREDLCFVCIDCCAVGLPSPCPHPLSFLFAGVFPSLAALHRVSFIVGLPEVNFSPQTSRDPGPFPFLQLHYGKLNKQKKQKAACGDNL